MTGERRGAAGLGDGQAAGSGPSPRLDAGRRASSSTGPRRFRPRPLARIGVALEHDQADAEILNRALSLAQADGQTRAGAAPRGRHADDPGLRRRDRRPRDRRRRPLPGRAGPGRCSDRGYRRASGPAPRARPRRRSSSATCERDPVDLLVVGSHGHGLVRDLLFGQTVDRVRHDLEIPMLIARPGAAPARRPAPRRRPALPSDPGRPRCPAIGKNSDSAGCACRTDHGNTRDG